MRDSALDRFLGNTSTVQPGGVYEPDPYAEPGEAVSSWAYDALLFLMLTFFGLMAIGLGHGMKAEGKRGALLVGYGIGLVFLWAAFSNC